MAYSNNSGVILESKLTVTTTIIMYTRGMPTDKPRSFSTASSADGISTAEKLFVTVVESNTSCPANVSAIYDELS